MTIYEKIKTALENTGVPVFHGVYHGTGAMPDEYVLFTTRKEAPMFADDKPADYSFIVYVEIWAKGNFSALQNKVTDAMTAADFDLIEEADVSDSDMAHLSQTWTEGADFGAL